MCRLAFTATHCDNQGAFNKQGTLQFNTLDWSVSLCTVGYSPGALTCRTCCACLMLSWWRCLPGDRLVLFLCSCSFILLFLALICSVFNSSPFYSLFSSVWLSQSLERRSLEDATRLFKEQETALLKQLSRLNVSFLPLLLLFSYFFIFCFVLFFFRLSWVNHRKRAKLRKHDLNSYKLSYSACKRSLLGKLVAFSRLNLKPWFFKI